MLNGNRLTSAEFFIRVDVIFFKCEKSPQYIYFENLPILLCIGRSDDVHRIESHNHYTELCKVFS